MIFPGLSLLAGKWKIIPVMEKTKKKFIKWTLRDKLIFSFVPCSWNYSHSRTRSLFMPARKNESNLNCCFDAVFVCCVFLRASSHTGMYEYIAVRMGTNHLEFNLRSLKHVLPFSLGQHFDLAAAVRVSNSHYNARQWERGKEETARQQQDSFSAAAASSLHRSEFSPRLYVEFLVEFRLATPGWSVLIATSFREV